MKIDFHVHITPPDIIANWEKYADKEPYFAELCGSKNNKFASAEDVIGAYKWADEQSGDVFAFDKVVVFGFAFRDMGLCRYVNDYVIEKVKQYKNRLVGFMVVSPSDDAADKEVERCAGAGLKGVGELFPSGQLFDPENDRDMTRLCRACGEFNLPLLIHANEPVGHYYPGKTDMSLKRFATFVKKNQELSIILAHWGGGLLFYETMREIGDCFRNVYYDTAATPFLYDARIYRAAIALGLERKIIFGSDFPLLPPSRYFDDIEAGGLSAEEKMMIFGGNAAKLLKI